MDKFLTKRTAFVLLGAIPIASAIILGFPDTVGVVLSPTVKMVDLLANGVAVYFLNQLDKAVPGPGSD